jgi:hypothetical protein
VGDARNPPPEEAPFDASDSERPAFENPFEGADASTEEEEEDDDEDGVELSLKDEDLVRTAFAAALTEAIGDRGLIDAPSRSRQDRAQLVEVVQTDLHGREIEELHFIAMSFGLAATIAYRTHKEWR